MRVWIADCGRCDRCGCGLQIEPSRQIATDAVPPPLRQMRLCWIQASCGASIQQDLCISVSRRLWCQYSTGPVARLCWIQASCGASIQQDLCISVSRRLWCQYSTGPVARLCWIQARPVGTCRHVMRDFAGPGFYFCFQHGTYRTTVRCNGS